MKRYFLSFIFILTAVISAIPCTNYLVTKGASATGSTMISYAVDSHTRYGEVYWRPAQDWPTGSMVTIINRSTTEPMGKIPQVPHTYQVVGFMNEHQVTIGESTFGGRPELVDPKGIMDYGAMMFIALQRSKTAREAIKVMTELVAEYGYGSDGESFSIGDPNEVWVMEMMPKGPDNKGAVWVAIRIPDGYVSSHANQARITKFPLENKRTSISSKNMKLLFKPSVEVVYAEDVISFARKKGYFKGKDTDFDFSNSYAPYDYGTVRGCDLRVWSFFNRVSDGMNKYWDYATGDITKERMPLFIRPNRKLTAQDLMAAKRDHLEGTKLDMSKDAGAGAFGVPYRWRPMTWKADGKEYVNERTTATQQTGFSFIGEMRSWLPNFIGGIFWYGADDANTTVYMPFYTGITEVPHCVAEGNGDILTYSDDASFWVFNRVAHFGYLFYNRVMPDLRKVQSELENKHFADIKDIDSKALTLYKNNDLDGVRKVLTEFCTNTANNTIKRWKELDNYLLVKFLDGNVKKEENGKFKRNKWGYAVSPDFPGYSDEWKKNVVEQDGKQFEMPEEKK